MPDDYKRRRRRRSQIVQTHLLAFQIPKRGKREIEWKMTKTDADVSRNVHPSDRAGIPAD
jgi:hypothetical protein